MTTAKTVCTKSGLSYHVNGSQCCQLYVFLYFTPSLKVYCRGIGHPPFLLTRQFVFPHTWRCCFALSCIAAKTLYKVWVIMSMAPNAVNLLCTSRRSFGVWVLMWYGKVSTSPGIALMCPGVVVCVGHLYFPEFEGWSRTSFIFADEAVCIPTQVLLFNICKHCTQSASILVQPCETTQFKRMSYSPSPILLMHDKAPPLTLYIFLFHCRFLSHSKGLLQRY